MVVLGIDPGLADTGFGLIKKQGAKLEMIDYGSIKTKAGQDIEIRLKEIYSKLINLIKKN